MNILIKNILIFVAGGAAGGLGTYFAVKKKFEAKADKEIEEMRNYYDNRGKTYEELQALGRIKEDVQQKIEKEEAKQTEAPASYKAVPKEETLIRGRNVKPVTIDYTQFYKDDAFDPADGEHPADDIYDEGEILTREHEAAGEPYVIERADFGSEPHYVTQTLTYYTVDDLLALGEDQNEDEIQDFDEIESMLGNTLAESGFMDDDSSMRIFVRNDKRCTDYEIVKVFGSFYAGHPE